MNILINPKHIPSGLAIGIGNFDGVHLGHGKIIEKTIEVAKANGLIPAILTFEPHPVNIFRPSVLPVRLTTFKTKLELIKKQGVGTVIVLKFNKAFSQKSAADFIQMLGGNHLITGENFHFGKGREGDTAMLRQQLGNKYTAVAPVGAEEVYSSSRIRSALKAGDIKTANHILGRNYYIEAKIRKGASNGSRIGFPTANLKIRSSLLKPKYGVYAVNTNFGPAVANFGVRPTLDGKTELLEVHIFNFDKNIYGEKLRVEFLDYIREEKNFDSVDKLKEQIGKDCDRARTIHAG